MQFLAVLASLLQLLVVSESERLLGLADEAQLGLLPSATCAAFAFSELRSRLQDAGLMSSRGMLDASMPQGALEAGMGAGSASQMVEPLVLPAGAAMQVHPSVLAWARPGTRTHDAISPLLTGLVQHAQNGSIPNGWDYWDGASGLHVEAHLGLFDSAQNWFDFEVLLWIVGCLEILGYLSIGLCLFWIVWVLDPVRGTDSAGRGSRGTGCLGFLSHLFCCCRCSPRADQSGAAPCCSSIWSCFGSSESRAKDSWLSRVLGCCGSADADTPSTWQGGWPSERDSASLNRLSRYTDRLFGSDYILDRDGGDESRGGATGEALNSTRASRNEASGDIADNESVARSLAGGAHIMAHQASSANGNSGAGSGGMSLPSAAH